MNCPSRNDVIEEEHPDWNQQPAHLSADLTTCQDLNGIVNARAHRKGSAGAGGVDGTSGGPDGKDFVSIPPPQPDSRAFAGGWRSFGPHPQAKKGVIGGEGHSLPHHTTTTSTSNHRYSFSSTFLGWARWIASVAICSFFLSGIRTPEIFASLPSASHHDQNNAAIHHLNSQMVVSTSSGTSTRTGPHLARRTASTCPTGGTPSEEAYNTPLHVGALFIILAVSFGACAFPLVATRFPRLRIPTPFFFTVRHFGTGVLLATAFVHLLPTAFNLLGNQCLSSFWVDDYPAMPGAIALAGVFFVTVIEMVLQPARHMTPGGAGHAGCMGSAAAPAAIRRDVNSGGSDSTTTPEPELVDTSLTRSPSMGTRHGNSESLARQLTNLERRNSTAAADDAIRPDTHNDDSAQAGEKPEAAAVVDAEAHHPHPFGQHGYVLTPAQQHQKDILQCMMLEVGILFHSVFIGMTLSVSMGSSFTVFLIAVAFHQMFEGLALGSRIASIAWPADTWQPWFMCLAYGCTTPIGQAIGLATHTLYNPDSEFGLILVGTMNAISSGLLVFASLVELLSEDFLSDESWRVLRGRRRVSACLLVLFGSICMSLIGAWA